MPRSARRTAVHGCLQVHKVPSQYDLFAKEQGRQHATEEERRSRAILYQQSSAKVARHNHDAGAPFKLALNHLADWTAAEYSALLGYKRDKRKHAWLQSASTDDEDAGAQSAHRTRCRCVGRQLLLSQPRIDGHTLPGVARRAA